MGSDTEYRSFDGICLTDTFQLGESDGSDALFAEMFPQNSARVVRQKKAPLRVIWGNPPYSVGQRSANDNAQNQKYAVLDGRIKETYVQDSSANLRNSLYDSYIKAFRWASDRLDDTHGGIICFVSNGGWIDGNAQDGLRKCLEREFTSIYAFNLRGNARTQGELRRREAGNVFGGGSRTPIAVTFLVKNPARPAGKAAIYYRDIGDYLSREEKLALVKQYKSLASPEMQWQVVEPNEHGDWLARRTQIFQTFAALAPEKKFDVRMQTFFVAQSLGVVTARDAWCYNFSQKNVESNMRRMIDFYNQQQETLREAKSKKSGVKDEDYIDTTPQKISWTRALRHDFIRGIKHSFSANTMTRGVYRPFCKQNLYFHRPFIESPGLSSILFPDSDSNNLLI